MNETLVRNPINIASTCICLCQHDKKNIRDHFERLAHTRKAKKATPKADSGLCEYRRRTVDATTTNNT